MFCRACGCADNKPLFKKERLGYYHCDNCKNVFLGNELSREEIEKFYDYYDANYNDSTIESSIGLLNKSYARILGKLEDYRQTNNLLDIGAGRGHFMRCAQSKGWNTFGTEFSESAYKSGKEAGLNLYHGDISEIKFSDGMFDTVTMWEVIEHCHDPQANFKAINRLLRRGGAIFMTTPNYNSMTRKIMGKDWSIFQHEHLSVFRISGLKRILNKYYFKPVWAVSENVSPGEILSFYFHKKAENTDCDQKIRRVMDSKPYYRWMKSAINYFLNISGCGDTIKAIFVKVRDI